MKKSAAYVLTFSFACFLFALNARAQKSFEGSITWNITSAQFGDDTIPMTMNMKDGNVEQQMNLGPQGMMKTFVLNENNHKKMYMAMEAMKMGMVMDVPPDTATAADAQTTGLTKTGKSAVIAGHHADEYLLKTAEGDLSVWASADFPKGLREEMANSMKDQPRQNQATSSAFMELASKGLMPVRIVMSKDGETAMSMELVSFEQKSLPDSLFVPPTDIKYRPMPTGAGGGMH